MARIRLKIRARSRARHLARSAEDTRPADAGSALGTRCRADAAICCVALQVDASSAAKGLPGTTGTLSGNTVLTSSASRTTAATVGVVGCKPDLAAVLRVAIAVAEALIASKGTDSTATRSRRVIHRGARHAAAVPHVDGRTSIREDVSCS